MDIRIDNLNNYPQYIDTVVNWLYSEWGNNNYKYWDSWVRSSLNNTDIPQTFVVFIDEKMVGTYSLWRCDLQSRQDLFPWFGGLFVSPDYRGKEYCGVKLGIMLQQHALDILKKYNYKKVYLFTDRDPKYYITNGWQIIDTAPNEVDKMVTICEYIL